MKMGPIRGEEDECYIGNHQCPLLYPFFKISGRRMLKLSGVRGKECPPLPFQDGLYHLILRKRKLPVI